MTDRMTSAATLAGVLTVASTLVAPCVVTATTLTETIAGRNAILYQPTNLSPVGSRALVVVLHGGMGNAERISSLRSEGSLNLNAVADAGGFMVAYLNGTRVSSVLGPNMLGWNAGACCGLPADLRVDDVAYLTQAIGAIAERYGINLKGVPVVGDALRDLQAGVALGCEPHLVLTGKGMVYRDRELPDTFPPTTQVHADLAAFAEFLLAREAQTL